MGVTAARPDTAKAQALGRIRGLARWRFQITEDKKQAHPRRKGEAE